MMTRRSMVTLFEGVLLGAIAHGVSPWLCRALVAGLLIAIISSFINGDNHDDV